MRQDEQKIIILSVSNDLVTDRRVDKIARSLHKNGFKPLLVGRKLKNSKAVDDRNYQTHRFKLLFKKSMLFYAEFNLRLFLFLLFKKANILLANDLDTLPANYTAYLIKKYLFRQKIFLVYDSHEYFTEVPELNGRRFAKSVWLAIEKMILPKLKNAYTVCNSIAEEYLKKYGIRMQIIRNIPECKPANTGKNENAINLKKRFAGKKIILYQGSLNIGRGLEQSILAMQYIEHAVLIIIGKGDMDIELKNLSYKYRLNNKVYFTGKIPLNELDGYTKIADLGLVLQADLSLSYRYVLPNRLFDFMQAGIPVLASDLPEIAKITGKYKTGILINKLNPEEIAKKINFLLNNPEKLLMIQENIIKIQKKYCWEYEEKKLLKIFKNLS